LAQGSIPVSVGPRSGHALEHGYENAFLFVVGGFLLARGELE